MTPYASRTGTRRNLAALRAAGWRLLVSATGVWRTEGFRYGIDNGAWTAHQRGEPFDAGRFRACLDQLAGEADWIVVPDIVAGGLRSLRLSESWLPELRLLGRMLLLPVQDGMAPHDVSGWLSPAVGIFVGGSDAFKESTMAMWGRLAREYGCHLHVGRVNTRRRIALCAAAGADSFDGTSASRFVSTLPLLDSARRQPDLFTARRTA